jgi:hypothetical protein
MMAMVNGKLPAWRGMPEISPLFGFIERPAGNVPDSKYQS